MNNTKDLILDEYKKWVTHYGPRISETSAKKYAADVRDFIDAHGHPAYVTEATCRQWFESVASKAAASTVNRKLSALKALFQFTLEKKMRDDDPLINLKMLRVPQRLPKPVAHPDILKLVAYLRHKRESEAWALQDLLIVEMLYGSGLRREEAATLRLANIKTSEVLNVIGKGNKERMTIITDPEFEVLVDWVLVMANREDLVKELGRENAFWFIHKEHPSQPIFWTAKLSPVLELSDPGHYLWERLTLRAKECGVRVTPHMLRHSFGTELSNNGTGLAEVAEVMGHEDPRTTRGYRLRNLHGLRVIRNAHTRQLDPAVRMFGKVGSSV
jgi:site-specific recombinase XerD